MIMAAAIMYALLNISCIHVCAEERQNLIKKLLVVIDNSGSMRSLDTVIQETLQIISAFDELAQDELKYGTREQRRCSGGQQGRYGSPICSYRSKCPRAVRPSSE